LQQVFINLLNNAADAMESGGTIRIRPPGWMKRWWRSEWRIPAPALLRSTWIKLFTPFFTTKPAGKGTGLGLSIVYGIFKMHYGPDPCQSELGQGTTIVITLPVRLPEGRLDRTGNAST